MRFFRLSGVVPITVFLLCGAVQGQGGEPVTAALTAIEGGDFVAAQKLLEPLAKEGDATAASTLAGVYFSQESGLRDPEAGLYWLTRAAESGHAASANSLGLVYLNGAVGAPDVPKALDWFRHGAAGGEVESAYFAGRILLETAQGRVQAEEGMAFLEQAVERQFPPAYHLLGTLYEKGQAVELDPDTAAAWYQRAAKAGFRPSIGPLVNLLTSGQVEDGSLSQARHWLAIAGKGGDDAALYHAGIMALRGIGGATDREAARDYFDRAAHLWNREAQYELGLIYLEDGLGNGRPEDVDRAYTWFDLSANAGHDLAHLMRTWAAEKMDAERVAAAHRAAQTWFDANHATPHAHPDLTPHGH